MPNGLDIFPQICLYHLNKCFKGNFYIFQKHFLKNYRGNILYIKIQNLQTQQTPNELAQDPLATPPRVEHSTLKSKDLKLNILF